MAQTYTERKREHCRRYYHQDSLTRKRQTIHYTPLMKHKSMNPTMMETRKKKILAPQIYMNEWLIRFIIQ